MADWKGLFRKAAEAAGKLATQVEAGVKRMAAGEAKPETLATAWQRAKAAPEAGREAALDALAAQLMQAEELWLLMDDAIGHPHPLLGIKGELTIFPVEAAAKRLSAFLHGKGMCDGDPVRCTRQQLQDLFQQLADGGHETLCVTYDGNAVVELPLKKLVPGLTGGSITRRNAPLRMMLLRKAAYLTHSQRMADPELKAHYGAALEGMGVQMHCNAWRFLGNTALWVLMASAPDDGVTRATKEALACLKDGDVSAVAEPDAPSFALYADEMNMKAVAIPGHEQGGHVLAFTSWQEAHQTLTELRKEGMQAGVVAASWREIAREAADLAGVLIDYKSLGCVIDKGQFERVAMFAAAEEDFEFDFGSISKPEEPAPVDEPVPAEKADPAPRADDASTDAPDAGPDALAQAWQRAKDAPEAEREAALDALARQLMQAEELWLLTDDAIGHTHPLTDVQGRLFASPAEGAAMALTAFLRGQGMCDGSPARYTRQQLPELFQGLADGGHVYLKITYDGDNAVELPLSKLVSGLTGGSLTRRNAPLRMMLLREMTYLTRLQRLTDPALKQKYADSLASMGMTMRYNAWKFLGNTALWVMAGPAPDDRVTRATQKAIACLEGEEIAQIAEPDAPTFSLYSDRLGLQTVVRPGQAQREAYVMAFTSWREAKETLAQFRQAGVRAGLVAASWSEIAGQAQEVAGVMIDFGSLRYRLGKEQFAEVAKSAASQAGFLFNVRTGDATAAKADLGQLWQRAHDAPAGGRDEAVKALAEALMQAETLHLIEEEVGSRQWPSVDEEGRVYAALDAAESGRLAGELQQLLDARCIPAQAEAAQTLRTLRDMGLTCLRVIKGGEAVDVPVEMCVPELSGGLVSRRNAPVRWGLLRTMEYLTRMRRMMDDAAHVVDAVRLNMLAEKTREEALKHPEALVLWVLVPAAPGAVLTQLTPEAIDAMHAKSQQLGEGGSRGASVCTAPLTLMHVTPADDDMRLAMAFTDWREAQRMREKTGQPGAVVGATFREIVKGMEPGANLLIDFLSLGFVLNRQDFPAL